jgi:V8-like Glu-specific endopeptidase
MKIKSLKIRPSCLAGKQAKFDLRNSIASLVALCTIAGLFNAPIALAENIPFNIRQAVVRVECGNRQGSGVVVNPTEGYVLTNAHVLLDLDTFLPASSCTIGFVYGDNYMPTIFYAAGWERYVFDESLNQDFAILNINAPEQTEHLDSFPYLRTDEFSETGDPLSIIAYPSSAKGQQVVTSGTINDLELGMIKTDAVISSGSSGGAGVDKDNNLIGLAERIMYQDNEDGTEEVVDYELVDIRAILTWLDTFGDNKHDMYIIHANADRYHSPATLFTPGNLQCTMLAKSAESDSVFCLRSDGTRRVFPSSAVYHTWFSDFSGVVTVSSSELAQYRLSSNITMKPGTLIKIQTDPKVYIVSTVDGSLRWIKTESKATELYGQGWAGFVKDVPDTFFINYKLGYPVE